MRFFSVILVMVSAVPCAGRHPLTHDRYRLTHYDRSRFDLYLVAPRPAWSIEYRTLGLLPSSPATRRHSDYSYELLKKVAAFVDGDARAKGHVNAVTEPRHLAELELLKNGGWPTLFITAPDDPDQILLSLAMAIPSFGEAPPFYYRFAGKGIPGFPEDEREFYSPHIITDSEDFSFSLILPEVSERPRMMYQPFQSRILRLMPWAVGTSAEFKFLVRSPQLRVDLVYALFQMIATRQLHRFSLTKMDGGLPQQQHQQLSQADYKNKQLYRLDQMLKYFTQPQIPFPLRLEYMKHLYQWKGRVRREEPLQSYLLNSYVYAQVSEPARANGVGDTSVSGRWFIDRVGFPAEPWLSFVENERSGTPGILTHIFRIPVHHVDLKMFDNFVDLTRQNENRGEYSLKSYPTMFPKDRDCDEIIEAALVQ